MPNWVTNQIDFYGDQSKVEALIQFITNGGKDVDFNSLIPMPQSLNIESGSSEVDSIIVYMTDKLQRDLDVDDKHLKIRFYNKSNIRDAHDRLLSRNISSEEMDKMYENGKIYCFNLDNYGCTSWYDWCCSQWGTKWNACHSDISYDSIYFDTAWSSPGPVIYKLAEKCKEIGVNFDYWYGDEDYSGGNCGSYSCVNGELDRCDLTDSQIYIKIWGYDPFEDEDDENDQP